MEISAITSATHEILANYLIGQLANIVISNHKSLTASNKAKINAFVDKLNTIDVPKANLGMLSEQLPK